MTSVRRSFLVVVMLAAVATAAATGAFAHEKDYLPEYSSAPTTSGGDADPNSGEPDTPHGGPQQYLASPMPRPEGGRETGGTDVLIERLRWAMRIWLVRL